jgi:hypothetical protein
MKKGQAGPAMAIVAVVVFFGVLVVYCSDCRSCNVYVSSQKIIKEVTKR